jgi:hypothetical protein
MKDGKAVTSPGGFEALSLEEVSDLTYWIAYYRKVHGISKDGPPFSQEEVAYATQKVKETKG